MPMKSLRCALFLLLLPTFLLSKASPSLHWPLPIHQGCTSSYGETRGQRFHGGVDFRTNYEEGWPVLALADGVVERFRRESYGYGRVLYLRLDDGRTAVYGHLCRFENDSLGLEDLLLDACRNAGTSFPGDVRPKSPLRVKAGQVVAYAGEMGVGHPHLHLEVRRGAEQLDPFEEGLPLPKGLVRPRILGVTFFPRESGGLVNGSPMPVSIPARRTTAGHYVLSRPVTLFGPVDAALAANDCLGIADKRTSVNDVTASLDGKEFFRYDLTAFTLDSRWEAGRILDPERGYGGEPGLILRRSEGVTIPGVRGAGLPAFSGEGSRMLEIVTSNHKGLTSTLTGRLVVGKGAPLWRLALPGSGYRYLSSKILPTGLLLKLRRTSNRGITPLLVDGHTSGDLLVDEGTKGRVQVLIPMENLPREGAAITIGKKELPFLAAAGPGGITAGKLRLNLPAGAVGTAKVVVKDPAGSIPGTAADLRVGPYPMRAPTTLTFSGVPPGSGLGVYSRNGGRYLKGFTGAPVHFRDNGVHCIKADRSRPQWGTPRIHTIPNIKAREVRLKLWDRGSGPYLKSLRLWIDGNPVYFDWDGDKSMVRIPADGLAKGRHTLKGSVTDHAGNPSKLQTVTFHIP